MKILRSKMSKVVGPKKSRLLLNSEKSSAFKNHPMAQMRAQNPAYI